MKLPHSLDRTTDRETETIHFVATNKPRAKIVLWTNFSVVIQWTGLWAWDAQSLEEFSEFLSALAQQLRKEEKFVCPNSK
jgi:hypothetical protein